ncbi:MAG: adenine phosphoribosyltransferase, partial [Gemmatimonadetes bacterium]|nr:adenine phosphoribosyltransferase [Gemmatimonadota bacterium]
ITPLLKDPAGLSAAVQAMLEPFVDAEVDLIVGIEARGFVFAVPIALELGCGFVPVRKPGKLPAATLSRDYALEYGATALEIHTDAIASGQKVLIVDDVLATGGTLVATCQTLEELGAVVVGISVLAELSFLSGRDRLAGYKLESTIVY